MNVMICDPISPKGIALLQQRPEFSVRVLDKRHTEAELLPLLGDTEAMVVRSETKVTRTVINAAPKLRVVARAGVGVDNVDVEVATQRGIVVMNTPGGNTVSTAEHTFAMLMALARKIPQANQSVKSGEWNRKVFQGVELYNKTLGILGMGRIGSEVARRGVAFGMRVLAYDPFLTLARAKALHVELVELDELCARADFITIHVPMTAETKGMINAAVLAKMKKGVRLINCARGGIIDERDLVDAIQAGQVAGAALDVFEQEPPPADFPLRSLPQVVLTPHVAASTKEAQDNVGIEAAEAVTDFLLTGAIRNAVNAPALDAQTYESIRPYLNLAQELGRLLAQLAPKRKDRLVVTYGGRATELTTDPVTRAALKGFLESAEGNEVNQVNARSLAMSLGLLVEEVKSNEETDFNEWLHLAVFSGDQRFSAGGTFFGRRHQPRIVRLNGKPVEIVPEGVLLILTNKDRPGIVGYLGSVMAQHKVNIASMSLNRDDVGGEALTVLNLDSVPPPKAIAEIEKDPDIRNVRIVNL